MDKRSPNILFILPDQHRPDWLGCNSDLPLRTPNIDRLCRDGVRFTNAYTPSPLCSPARACLATGLDYRNCGVIDNGQNTPLAFPTYYRALRDAGYEVAGVGKFDLHKADSDWGLDGSKMVREYGFTKGIDNEGKGDAINAYRKNGMSPKGPYMQFLKERGLDKIHVGMYDENRGGGLQFSAVTELPDDAYCDNWVASNALKYLSEFSEDRPWHLVVNFVGPHGPFDVTPAMRERWKDVSFPEAVSNNESESGSKEILLRRQNYAATIENIDEKVGGMIDLLEKRGELDNTLIIYSSDHGEMLGDHGRWGKSIWYTAASGIPLIVSGPGIRKGAVSDALVSLHDLAATFMDYANIADPPRMDAVSIRPVLEGRKESHRDCVTSGLNDWRMVFDGRFKLVKDGDGVKFLYDLEKDPREINDISKSFPDKVVELSAKIAN